MRTNSQHELERVLNIVCEETKVHPMKVRGRSRKRDIVMARHMYCYFGYNYANCTYNFIAESIGRDHTTALNSITVVDNLLTTDFKFREELKRIESIVSKHLPPSLVNKTNYKWEPAIDKNIEVFKASQNEQ